MKVWEESITIDILDFKLFLKLSSVFSTSILLCYVFNIKMSFITVFKNKLLTKVDARTNGWRHENRCIKRPSHLWQYRSITLDFFLLVNAYVDIDQGIHLGKKDLTNRGGWVFLCNGFHGAIHLFEYWLLLLIYFWTQCYTY